MAATVDFARANSSSSSANVIAGNVSRLSDGAGGGHDATAATGSHATKINNTASSAVTVDAIGRQIQQRDAALEVVAMLQALTAITAVRSRAIWLLELSADQLVFSTLRLSHGDPRTPLCIELIWNLLQLRPAEAMHFASRESYETLQDTLRIAVAEGHIATRRELRNDIIVVFALLADAAPDSQCVSATLVDLVLQLACGIELGLQPARDGGGEGGDDDDRSHQQGKQSTPGRLACDSRSNASSAGGKSASTTTTTASQLKQHHTTRNEDLQLKILGWDLLRRWCCADEALASIAFGARFFDALLCYIDVTCANRAVVAWSAAQLLELQEHALRIVEELIRVGCAWFCAARGPSICVSYVLECPARPEQLLLRAVSVLAEAASSPARVLVADTGAIPLTLRLLSSEPLSRESSARHVDCLTLLADLVDRTERYQSEFGNNGGVDIVLPLLHGAVDYADLGDELMIAAVDCVWACVLGLSRNEERFVALGGVGALLAILDVRRMLWEQADAKAKTLASSLALRQPKRRGAGGGMLLGGSGAAGGGGGGGGHAGRDSGAAAHDDDDDYEDGNGRGAANRNDNDGDGVKNSDGGSVVSSRDEAANFPLACLADLLAVPDACDAARKWRSPRTGRSGMQVLLSLWSMAPVPPQIVAERNISPETAAAFDVGCAVLGQPTRTPLPIGDRDDRSGDGDGDGDGDGGNPADGGDENDGIIPSNPADPAYVARAGIVVAARDVRQIATVYRQNLKVHCAIAALGYNGHHELELEERACLTTVQQFVALCKDEIWETVTASLLGAGVDPTGSDAETLRVLREAAEQRACSLQATRAAFAEMQRRRREVAERTFYEALMKRTEQRMLPASASGAGGARGGGAAGSGVRPGAGGKSGGGGAGLQQHNHRGSGGDGRAVHYQLGGSGDAIAASAAGSTMGLESSTRPANMSITEAKMRNKMMLKSSFKQPVKLAEARSTLNSSGGDVEDDEDYSGDEDLINLYDGAIPPNMEASLALNANHPFATSSKMMAASMLVGNGMQRWGIGQKAMVDDEYALFAAINALRTDPRAFIPVFEAARKRFDASVGAIAPAPDTADEPIVCEEGAECLREAIAFLRKARPMAAQMDVPMGMLLASRDFVRIARARMDNVAEDEALLPAGAQTAAPLAPALPSALARSTRGGSRAALERMRRYGRPDGRTMQLVALGCASPEAVILQLVLGDGNPERPDRVALFDPEFRCCGVALADHDVYRKVVCVSLAASYADKPHHEQRAAHSALWSDL